jgi:cytochrome c biogenesis protein CcmG/thiol:disulfide interchange protein DsbE
MSRTAKPGGAGFSKREASHLVLLSLTGMLGMLLVSVPCAAADPPVVRAPLLSEKDRKPAPKFQLKDRSGATVKLSDYRGRILLLNFWATWCGGCKQELPWFQEFAVGFSPRRFAVLGVSVDEEGWAAVNPYLEKTNVTYRMALAEKSTPGDYAVKSMPATFLIDRKGRIAAAYIGLVDRADLEANIRSTLAQR